MEDEEGVVVTPFLLDVITAFHLEGPLSPSPLYRALQAPARGPPTLYSLTFCE